ncbi:MFS transporter [Streptomyces qinglanensis]|uniref:Major Facilitator Superfamily protein n=1 Tax=Streptomyces qinglanensis TaxID=943816 RepID=A0A1H9SBW0_9ACTN|nr:MFS transporter [Streptomyces qinglanensis]SER81853.1 Major Facilitator Superfamily protein [Streptomyces qinglanensis]
MRQADKPGFDRRLLAPMLLGSVLNPVNSTIISVALVPIGAALGAPPSQTAWLVSALYLATALGQPVVGRLIDLFGPRRLFLLSTALVGVAGVVGTAAPDLGVLIGARVLLGFGTCAGYPSAMALVRSESERTGRDSPRGVLTALAVANQTVAVVGPLLGGLLIAAGGWRATFALNVPLSVAAVLLGLRRLPRTTGADRIRPARTGPPPGTGEPGGSGESRPGPAADSGPPPREGPAARLDLPGMALFAATLTSLLLFLMNLHLRDWYLLVIAATAATAFALRELRTAAPFIDLRVLGGNTPLLATFGRALLAYTVSYSFLYGFSQWTEEGYGLTPFHAGLVQMPMFLLAIGVAVVAGRRAGVRGKLVVGALGQLAASAVLLTLTGRSALWMLVLVALIFGVPQGLNNLALQNSVYFQADPERTASSAGLLRTFAYVGSMIASSAAAASFGQHADTAGMHRLGCVMLGAGALHLLLTALDRSLGRVAAADARAAAE